QAVNDNGREDLFYLNKKALMDLGFPEHDSVKVLNLPYFSPREATYFRVYLEKLKTAENWKEIFRAARRISGEWPALKLLYAAQLAADAQDKEHFKKLHVFEEGIGLLAKDRIIFMAPYDDLDSGLAGKIKGRIETLKKEWGVERAEVWNAGKVQARFGSLKVREWMLFAGAKT
ncbi:MAG TPA: hypothetical protein VJC08_04250, partial [bacterium]|nr:hypothetical protein [bacterium]